MRLWRLSGAAYAHVFDGGYGLAFDGRWNTVGHPITYAATSPSLCVLEKFVHVENPDRLPALSMVVYDVPDDLGRETIDIGDLPPAWQGREDVTQSLGDAWLEAAATPLLFVPSAIVPIAGSPDLNVLINHRSPAAIRIRIASDDPFSLDVRLL